MVNKYLVEVNGTVSELKDFTHSIILPEVIRSLKIDFQTSEPEGINIIALLVLLETLVEKIKNKTEYTLLIENLINCILVIKKMEMDAGLGDNTY